MAIKIRNTKDNGSGWHYESMRHGLAAKGMKTGSKEDMMAKGRAVSQTSTPESRDETYEGWTNRDTWLIRLHADNTPEGQRMTDAWVKNIAKKKANGTYDSETMEPAIKKYYIKPNAKIATDAGDEVNLNKVDSYDILHSLERDADEYNKEHNVKMKPSENVMSIQRVKSAHENNYKGHFFEKSSMRFFDAKVDKVAYSNKTGDKAYFVTSEQFHGTEGSNPRKYSVRMCDLKTGNIKTIGDFNTIGTHAEAKKKAIAYSQEY